MNDHEQDLIPQDVIAALQAFSASMPTAEELVTAWVALCSARPTVDELLEMWGNADVSLLP